ncbi:MAG: ribonuclease III [Candidatus Colwellbacteria bacterium]|nr:ribonuclease III [Candidatus Colwellbacteria bacterium]
MSINTFQADIGIIFKNAGILKEALTHRSYINENPEWQFPHNERLEFLGDAVLELITTNHLFKALPKSEEGELTMIRAALVNTKMLAKIAEEMGIGDYLLTSKGAIQIGSKAIETIFADAFEAIVGAIYLDQGYDIAEKFIKERVLSKLDEVKKAGFKDAKSLLQEEIQERYKVVPTYDILEEKGPEHQKVFRVAVKVNKELEAEGEGTSKQEAELAAAKELLQKLNL